MPLVTDMKGKRFGRLLVLDFAHKSPYGARWHVLCDCGEKKIVTGCHLRNGNISSCGCRMGRHSHGLSDTAEYRIWSGIIQRCTNPKVRGFKNYGGRGIVVCDRWTCFEHFIEDMGPRPSDKHSIERKENGGPYSPDNCYWATKREQVRNYRRNRKITHGDLTLPLCDMAETFGLKPATLRCRLNRGWSVAKALTKKVRPWGR